jgi:hypothetical protein
MNEPYMVAFSPKNVSEALLENKTLFRETRPRSRKTRPCSGKQDLVLENKTLFLSEKIIFWET